MFAKILHRPAMAIVLSIILLLLGVLGIKTLPIAQFPDIAPPTVMVSISYPGASANVLVESVLIPLEQSINGASRTCGFHHLVRHQLPGEAAIIIYFGAGHQDSNINVPSNVQNRVNIVLFQLLPRGWCNEGILVSQVVPSMLMYVNIYSTGSQRRSERPLQLRQRLRHAPAQGGSKAWASPGISATAYLRDAGLAESRPHSEPTACPPRMSLEGPGGTEHDWFARTTRPGATGKTSQSKETC